MTFLSIKSHKKFLSKISHALHYSFTRDPPHFRMIKKMLIASRFYDKFIKLTTFLGLFSIAFTILMTSAIFGNFLFHFLASCPRILHDTLDTRNIWCDLLYERNNAISNADHSPCTVYGFSFAFQPRHTVFGKVIGQFFWKVVGPCDIRQWQFLYTGYRQWLLHQFFVLLSPCMAS